tara:strand:- start:106 stop:468 length:363 start_codon:yes stop_codon:yes gene_type:complete
VLQSLYEIEVGGSDLKEILKTRSKERKNTFFKNLLIGVTNLIDDLDATLKTGIDRSIKQLDPIERNILRIAIYELEKKELEPVIIISEAIRMSKKYGSTDGYKFVNAVLDKLVKEKGGKR